MENQESTPWFIAKIASVWAAVGITSWSEAASFVAFLYTLFLFGLKIWTVVIRPLLVNKGYLKPLTPAQVAANEGDNGAL